MAADLCLSCFNEDCFLSWVFLHYFLFQSESVTCSGHPWASRHRVLCSVSYLAETQAADRKEAF